MEGPAHWQFGSGGPRLKVNGAAMEARNADDDGLVMLRTAGPAQGQVNLRRAGASPFESWYLPQALVVGTLTNLAATADKLYLAPFQVEENEIFDRQAIRVTTASAGNCRLGLYSIDIHAWTGALVIDSGTVATGSTGVKTLTLSQALTPGWYATAAVFDATPTLATWPASNSGICLGFAADLVTRQSIVSAAFTYGALPADFSGLTLAAESAFSSFVFHRRAS
jgi:hypothetical protein